MISCFIKHEVVFKINVVITNILKKSISMSAFYLYINKLNAALTFLDCPKATKNFK